MGVWRDIIHGILMVAYDLHYIDQSLLNINQSLLIIDQSLLNIDQSLLNIDQCFDYDFDQKITV